MGKVIVLGSANAVADATHENTHLLIQGGERLTLVDCPGSPIARLRQAGIDPARLTDVILTHFHPDHTSGFALLVLDLWLLGRKEPLAVYGLPGVVESARRLLDLYEVERWPGLFSVEFHAVDAETEPMLVLSAPEYQIQGALVKHMIPALGLRVEFADGGVFVYSTDTEPCEAVQRLAKGARVLMHESAGAGIGHTGPEQAGEAAARAGVERLYLIHYATARPTAELEAEAARKFSGKVTAATDLMEIDV